jgi:hypothetical protein
MDPASSPAGTIWVLASDCKLKESGEERKLSCPETVPFARKSKVKKQHLYIIKI